MLILKGKGNTVSLRREPSLSPAAFSDIFTMNVSKTRIETHSHLYGKHLPARPGWQCAINSPSPLLINEFNIHMEVIACNTLLVFHQIRQSHFHLRTGSKHLLLESIIIVCLYRTNHVPAALPAERSQVLASKSLQTE